MKLAAQDPPADPQVRSTYRHGDLRRALLEAGVALARAGGPDAVVLREATRRAGVVPNAAYRHFASRQALLQAVRAEALRSAAEAMQQELSEIPPQPTPADAARAKLRAVGSGYLRFALAETGLFRTAFGPKLDAAGDASSDASTETLDSVPHARRGLHPFELLGAALDQLVDAGAMPHERRPGAEYLAWSAVHGMALLVIDGPLQSLSHEQVGALGQRLLNMVEQGLAS
ncbi:MAG: TetR/AcrR family transcriptional regulator [Gammaproteobacteria bacterium]|nr:TetR/AcrR family transcriptional regulator [Gammaproteobacteria bacterium]MBU1442437.1 TetR/AcrR family transcriptional regulator [Gammaproteobacteria bacterium]